GILHIETPPEWLVQAGGLFHGFQLWVNLPAADKWMDPAYQDLRADDVTLLTSQDGASLLRLIAGEVDGHTGPGSTHTPITMIHATLHPGARVRLPWPTRFNALAYVLNGRGRLGSERRPVGEGQLAVFGAGDVVELAAPDHQDGRSPDLDVLVIGGLPIREQVAWYGPFVMNSKAEVAQAYEDFQRGRFGRMPAHPHGHG
ncbi:MAG: pirin-like C-terminal cupin domain-containing protein, partial [Acidimicrobiia bacterium]